MKLVVVCFLHELISRNISCAKREISVSIAQRGGARRLLKGNEVDCKYVL